jgi:UDP-N-acetylenolpyruvoylglucosamine reductase
METYSQQRRQSQPRDPSAGCVFRNPTSHHAGRMIDGSGLKGAQVGSAMVSPIHANFIINKGEASAADVLGLMREVRRQVQLKHGQLLEPEIIALGREWRDLL